MVDTNKRRKNGSQFYVIASPQVPEHGLGNGPIKRADGEDEGYTGDEPEGCGINAVKDRNEE